MREQYVKPEAVEISFAMADAIAAEDSWGFESGFFGNASKEEVTVF